MSVIVSNLEDESRNYLYYRNIAFICALNSDIKKRCGAILVYRNKIISTGYNYSTKISSGNNCCLL